MKKLLISGSLFIFLMGMSGCGTDSEKTSATESTSASEKVESSTTYSTEKAAKKSSESEKETSEPSAKQSTTSQQSTNQTEAASSEGESEFKELLSGIEYNKEYLTEDQIAELKETYKESLTEAQYKELVALLDK